MANIRIVHTNHIDPEPETGTAPTMTITDAAAATAADATEISYLRNSSRDACTITGTSPYDIKGNWGGEQRTVGFVGLFRHTLAGGSIRIQLYSDAAYATGVYDSGTLTINPPIALGSFLWGIDPTSDLDEDRLLAEAPYLKWITPQLCKSYKITITSSVSIKQIGRLFVGGYYEFTNPPNLGAGVGVGTNVTFTRMAGGSNRNDPPARWKRMELDLAMLTDNERAIMLDVVAINTGRDVVVSVFPEDASARTERDYTINGKFIGQEPVVYANLSYRSKKIVIEGN